MKTTACCLALLLTAVAVPASAAEISAQVLDLSRGVVGKFVPATLSTRMQNCSWNQVDTSRADGDRRVRSFGESMNFDVGT